MAGKNQTANVPVARVSTDGGQTFGDSLNITSNPKPIGAAIFILFNFITNNNEYMHSNSNWSYSGDGNSHGISRNSIS